MRTTWTRLETTLLPAHRRRACTGTQAEVLVPPPARLPAYITIRNVPTCFPDTSPDRERQ